MNPNTNSCLVPGCTNPIRCRGLCQAHYNYAILLVRTGRTTMAELEAHGKIKPASRGRSSPSGQWLLDFKTKPTPTQGQ